MSKSWHLYAAATLMLLLGCKQEVCDNNLDDDNNGAIDCDDDTCRADASCGPRCGDDTANAGEDCDGSDLNGASCLSLGADGGTLVCNTACQFDQSQCVNDGVCGDNAVDPGEDCDGNNLGGASCLSLGLEDGILVCDGTCQFNPTGCGTDIACGNNILELGEQCDDGCLSGTPNVCEAIDNGDGCSSACQTEVLNGTLVINEVDYDQFNSDTTSFVEIFNGSNAAVNLTGLSLVFINGADNTEYDRSDLGGAGSLNPGQFLVIGNDTVVNSLSGAVKTISKGPDDILQNGSPDGVILINAANQVLDSLSYEGSITTCTLTGGANVSFSDTGFDGADTNGDGNGEDFNSIARNVDGVDTNNNNADWSVVTPATPGAANP
jgi:hypothetical protein